MKKLVYAMLMAAAAFAAFADGDDNIVVLVSTAGPDTYKGGETVLDGECYAIVWSSDGVFEGFTAGGEPIDKNDRIVNVGAVATNGHCRAAFEISATLADSLKNGIYAVYLLDTRVKEGETVSPRGLVNGKLAVRNTPAEIVQFAFLVFGQIARLSFGSVLLVMRGGGKFRQFAFFCLSRGNSR